MSCIPRSTEIKYFVKCVVVSQPRYTLLAAISMLAITMSSDADDREASKVSSKQFRSSCTPVIVPMVGVGVM